MLLYWAADPIIAKRPIKMQVATSPLWILDAMPPRGSCNYSPELEIAGSNRCTWRPESRAIIRTSPLVNPTAKAASVDSTAGRNATEVGTALMTPWPGRKTRLDERTLVSRVKGCAGGWLRAAKVCQSWTVPSAEAESRAPSDYKGVNRRNKVNWAVDTKVLGDS